MRCNESSKWEVEWNKQPYVGELCTGKDVFCLEFFARLHEVQKSYCSHHGCKRDGHTC